ncbi:MULTISPECIES: hypothetical protein [unclassified Streptomyces]|uniref:hypothetical protein n=1 Tax=unclassified Streptomyces TaxID=2593676 RepID=UPI003243DB66
MAELRSPDPNGRTVRRGRAVGMGSGNRVAGAVTVALAGALMLVGCSGGAAGPDAGKPGAPAPDSAPASAPPAPSPSEPATAQPSSPASTPGADARPSATGEPAPKRTPGGPSEIPQNPNRGPNPPPAPDRPPPASWKPTPFDPKDPSIPNYTVPPPMR